MRSQITDSKIPDKIEIDLDIMSNWLGSYSEMCTLERNRLDFVPWSRRARQVQKQERFFFKCRKQRITLDDGIRFMESI